jgi:hypoxanthine phosphoribosyltransferase
MELTVQIFAIIGALAAVISALIAVLHWAQVYLWKRKLTWDDSLRTAAKVLADIQRDNWLPDIVVGLGRSGGIWGGWIAGNLGSLPFAVVDDKYPDVQFPGGAETLDALRKTYPGMRRMLVVEGATGSGRTINEFKSHFSDRLKGLEVRFAVLYRNPAAASRVDYVGEIGPEPWPERLPWHRTDLYRPHLRDLLPSAIPAGRSRESNLRAT